MDFFELTDFRIIDAIDIVLVAALLYYLYRLVKGTVAINIFIGIALVVLIWKITQALQMEMLSGLLGTLISLGAIAILIVFQPEVRKFLLMLGSTNFTNKRNFLKQLKIHRRIELWLQLHSINVMQTKSILSILFQFDCTLFDKSNDTQIAQQQRLV